MNIQFFCPRWGSEDISWPAFMDKVKAAGYDGIEWAIARNFSGREIEQVQNWAEQRQLLLIAQHYDTNEANFNSHFAAYSAWLEKVKAFPWSKISSQTGKDYFNYAQNAALIKLAGKQVLHETHRGKFSFAAHVTKNFLETIPDLRLTLDVSHWVCVAESLLDDQQEAVYLALSRTDHIHARVGYPEGPQVPDPKMTAWQQTTEHHLHWWDRVVDLKKADREPLTITTEFGPFPYLVNPAGTGQWALNCDMMELLKKRYG